MYENEELVVDQEMDQVTEPEKQPEAPEETPEAPAEPAAEQEEPKKFTQAEVDKIVSREKARARARGEREAERKYESLMQTLRTGTGKQTVEELDHSFRDHYEKQGIPIRKPAYSARDSEILGKADAQEIIDAGFEDVVAETNRLAKLGVANMTPQDKIKYRILAEHRQSTERSRELAAIGVTDAEIQDPEFQAFAKMFDSRTPITKVYETYRKTKPQKEIKTMGSMKQAPAQGAKDFYTEEEISRLTDEELDDPKVWEAVRRSMTGGT